MQKAFSVQVSKEFAAAHHIRGYDGECSRPHGHNYKIVVNARTPRLSNIGIAVDFKILKRVLGSIIEKFDHQDLNTIEPFDKDLNPTAETLAQYFFDELEHRLKKVPESAALELTNVTVWENERSNASYGLI